jgi:endonuclease/exonuclease/phosphatase (EEP) superfamily protein YafD
MRSSITTALLFVAYSYLVGLFAWAVLHTLAADRWWWLFLLSTLACYLFLPLLLLPAIALYTQQHALWPGIAVGALLWLYLYGGLLLPAALHLPAQADAPALSLRVMTYNMLVHNTDSAGAIAAIRTADADIVALQELHPAFAAAIQHELRGDYPYQVLVPREDTTGMGVISRYPMLETGDRLRGSWGGVPQILRIDAAGTHITLVNIHARSTSLGYGGNLRISPASIEASIREREQQMQALAAFVAAQRGPLIVAGDFNTGDQSRAYGMVARVLNDAWREVGHGLGHTFPGSATPGSSRPSVAGVRLPMWLVRIDYIFYSEHWQAREAEIGPWDGVSDHRPVVARLVLAEHAAH